MGTNSKLSCLVSLAWAIHGCAQSEPAAPDVSAVSADVKSPLVAPTSQPASVPTGFVATPQGYFHPSCVVEVAESERVHADSTIARADGTTRKIKPCAWPHYDRAGRMLGSSMELAQGEKLAQGEPPQVNGWVADTYDNSHGPYRGLSAIWNVPVPPGIAGTQIIYLFPGLQADTILQPVLGWNQIGEGPRWTIASWNCCRDGTVMHSPFVQVAQGDEIAGSMTGTNCDANGVCANWNIVTTDHRTGASTSLATSAFGKPLNLLFGAALEAYGVDHCAQYPATSDGFFHHITSTVVGGGTVTFPWVTSVDTSVQPWCANDVSAPDATAVTLKWAPTLRPTPARPGCRNVFSGQGIVPLSSVLSCNGQFILMMQLDGNLVLYYLNANGTLGPAIWATNTFGNTRAYDAVMQSDGNFVLYDMSGNPLWATGTWGHPGAYFAVQDDGNLVVYASDGAVLWHR
jgi:hypothetical protein